MANYLSASGFRGLRHSSGGDPTRTNPYKIAAGYAVSIFENDPVKSDGAGNIVLAAAGDAILGMLKGCYYVTPQGEPKFSNFWPASTQTLAGSKIVANVVDDPMMTFAVQCSTAAAYASAGKFVNLVVGTGNLTTGLSTASVGTPGGAASQFQILRIRDTEPILIAGNASVPVLGLPTDGAFATLEVKAVKHERLGAAAGVAA